MRAGASAEASIQIFRTDLRAGHQRNAGMLASPEIPVGTIAPDGRGWDLDLSFAGRTEKRTRLLT
jgi:hypothetical protein